MKSGVVYVKNTLSSTVKRYSSYSLGDSIWTLDRDRNLIDCVFELVAYSASKPVAVLQYPLAPYTADNPEFGLAVVDGSTLVECNGSGATTDQYATPQSDGRVQATGSGPIRLAQARPSGGGFVLGIIGVAPSPPPAPTGIAQLTSAMTARSGLACGSATANKLGIASGSLSAVGGSITLYNTTSQTAASGMIVQWKRSEDGASYLWDVGDCSLYTGPGLETGGGET
jgi:hypothetical protein